MAEPQEGTQIEVRLTGLRDFAAQLRRQTETMRDCLATANRALKRGTPFGATSQSGYVFDAKQRYQTAASRAVVTMENYVLMADALAAAADEIAARYADTDALAAARAKEVESTVRAELAARKPRSELGASGGRQVAV